MAYARPGVYVNETLSPITPTTDTGGTATACFVGSTTAGGPVDTPTFITSWTQYLSVFGGFAGFDEYLPYAVYSYFSNGGAGCYVVRCGGTGATASTVNLENSSSANVLSVTAIGEGSFGSQISVSVVGSGTAGKYNLVVNKGYVTENFYLLDGTNVESIVNAVGTGSNLVRVSYTGAAVDATHPFDIANNPSLISGVSLANGTDGAVTPANLANSAQSLSSVSGLFDVNVPGVNDPACTGPLVTWAQAAGNVFVVIDGAQGAGQTPSDDNAAANAAAQQTLAASQSPSSLVGIYGPWLVCDDPAANASSASSAARLLPPGGAVLGQYSRMDTLYSPAHAPAGVNTVLRNVRTPKVAYTAAQLDSLNVAGFNVLLTQPNIGTVIWGARTTKTGTPDRYISISRSLIYLTQNLVAITAPAVFEINDSDLWDYLTAVVEQYLQTQWQMGLLSGGTADAAFFVECDAANNPPDTAGAGVVNIQVGLALSSPAEYIIINIGQTPAGATVTTDPNSA